MRDPVFSRDEIRLAVRQALLEALPAKTEKGSQLPAPGSQLMKQLMSCAQAGCKAPVAVDLSTDRKVNAFVKELMGCLEDKNLAGLIGSGRLRFQVARASSAGKGTIRASQPEVKSHEQSPKSMSVNGRVDCGGLTESKILALSNTHQRVEIGPGVIMTPLAKYRARRLNIQLVRQ